MKREEVARDMRAIWRRGLRPGSPAAFAFAILCVAAATLLRQAIDLIAHDAVPFATYFPAILIASLVGGVTAGILALVLSGAASWLMFVSPRHEWVALTADQVASLGLFGFASIMIIWIAERYRALMLRIYQEQRYRKVIVDELGHRLKNKLATVHAILRHELRGHEDIWDSVSGRLHALSVADDFIVQADGEGVDLRQLLEMEMLPYGASKVTLRGEPVLMFSKLPSVLALVFHELATNSAKYGSLSALDGRVDISWDKTGDSIAVTWRETGGPKVTPPSRRSFGSNLIERSLIAFGGSAKIDFAESGVICRIRLPKTEKPPAAASPAS
jgi:two-component sensor histidine kinase